jgi:sec-independent protein translocase protein TatB
VILEQQDPQGYVFVVGVIGRVSLAFMGPPPTIELGSLGMADSLILMVLGLVVLGPRRLPQVGRQIGKLMFEFRKASNDFKFQMEEELRLSEDAERRKKEEEKRKQLAQESVSATPAVVKALEASTSGEGQTPEVIHGAAGSEDVAPRILPPATGEPVAARRSELAELTEPPADAESVSSADSLGLDQRPDRKRAVETSSAAAETATGSTTDEHALATETVRPNG